MGRSLGDSAVRNRGLPDLGPFAPDPTQIREHRPRLDRGELRRIAEQDEPGAVRQRTQYLRHEGEIHHRPFVEDERIGRESLPDVVEKPAVHRRRPGVEPFEGRRPGQKRLALPAHRFLEAGRRLAGGGRERDPIGGGEPQLDEQGHDRRRGGGLAGAGTARHHAEPAENGDPGRRAGAVIGRRAGKEPVERGIEAIRLGPRTALRDAAAGCRIQPLRIDTRIVFHEPAQAVRHRLLRRSEPFEVETALPVEHQRAPLPVPGPGDDRARIERLDPRFERGKPHRAGSRPRPVPARHLG